jgi:hypothetical protein
MLTKGDDYPLHQTPEPIAYSDSNRNFYDRYFFNGYDADGELFFAVALGVYPHLNIMDAAFSVVHDGVQHDVHASKVLHMERLDTRVGPVCVEVIEPLRVLGVRCDDGDNGIRAELAFHARALPVEEPRFRRRIGSALSMDYTRLTQNGTWEGAIEVRGKRFDVTRDVYWGTRDRSWGIRGIGARDNQRNPYAERPQFYWLWCPLNFDDCITLYHSNADADGEAWNTNGVICPLLGEGEPEVMLNVGSEVTFKSGTRHAAHAVIDFRSKKGEDYQIEVRPKYEFFMRGLGYTHPDWGHGAYKGELETGYEATQLSEINPADTAYFHVQAISEATLRGKGQERIGRGVLEQLIIGPHAPSGFKDLVDLAP